MENVHEPVMLKEVLEYLNPQPNQNFIDGTLGGGGHTKAILELTGPEGKVIAIDEDPLANKITQDLQKEYKDRLLVIQNNFRNIKKIKDDSEITTINGILLDLGLSSNQIADRLRGFSFISDGPLDMRFSGNEGRTAADIINSESVDELTKIFKEYGEEPQARAIAKKIVEFRKEAEIQSSVQLAELVEDIYKRRYRTKSKVHPATRVFQALRIAVNDELNSLQQALDDSLEILEPGGRLVVISYHSLEDRIMKSFVQREARDCICAADVPICQCEHKKQLNIITKKPLTPSEEEVKKNPRSRSAKIRVAEKI